MKNITLFICSLHSGGAEHQLSVLANMLAERDYNVRIITFSDKPDHYHLHPSIKRVKIYHSSKVYKFIKLLFYLMKHRTECFISFGQRENFISILPFFFKRTKYIAGERNNSIGKPSTIERLLVNYLYRRADYIVPNSDSQGRHLVNSNPSLVHKIRVIHNYTDLELFSASQLPENTIVQIGVFCRFEPQKNIIRFAEAMKQLRDKCKIPFRIVWYGNQSFVNKSLQSYFDRFKEQIIRDHLDDIIIIHDPVKNVHDYMLMYDAIALPSLHEGFSNAISEAICCGRPVLASRVSDNSVMVHDSENGFLFDPTDPTDIVNAFTKFLYLPIHIREKFGQNSRRIAESLFNKEKFISDYISIIS